MGGFHWDPKIPNEAAFRVALSQSDSRNAAILMLLYDTGLSVSDVAAFDVGDVAPDKTSVSISREGHSTPVALSDLAAEAIKAWLRDRGPTPGPLFYYWAAAGEPGRLSARAVRNMVTRVSKLGVVVAREVDKDGWVHCYDSYGRPCWDTTQPERVILVADLRRYAEGLHVGQLGWTVPEMCDPPKWVRVRFDNGVDIDVVTSGLKRPLPERAEALSREILAANSPLKKAS